MAMTDYKVTEKFLILRNFLRRNQKIHLGKRKILLVNCVGEWHEPAQQPSLPSTVITIGSSVMSSVEQFARHRTLISIRTNVDLLNASAQSLELFFKRLVDVGLKHLDVRLRKVEFLFFCLGFALSQLRARHDETSAGDERDDS